MNINSVEEKTPDSSQRSADGSPIFNSQDIKLSKQVFSCNPKDVPFKRISLPMTRIIAAKERLIIGSGTKKYERIKNLYGQDKKW